MLAQKGKSKSDPISGKSYQDTSFLPHVLGGLLGWDASLLFLYWLNLDVVCDERVSNCFFFFLQIRIQQVARPNAPDPDPCQDL